MKTVQFNGKELAYLAGAIANALPELPEDFEIYSKLLDRLLSVLDDLDEGVLKAIEARRELGRKAYLDLGSTGWQSKVH